MFVGETEKTLRAFNEAQQKNAILMLDEVDSEIFRPGRAHSGLRESRPTGCF